jgi:hypothetical protein
MNNELERIGKEVVVALARYYPGICLEGLSKTAETFRLIGGPGRDPNQAPPETLQLPQTGEVLLHVFLASDARGEWPASSPARLPERIEPRNLPERGLGGPQSQSGRYGDEEFFALVRNWPFIP